MLDTYVWLMIYHSLIRRCQQLSSSAKRRGVIPEGAEHGAIGSHARATCRKVIIELRPHCDRLILHRTFLVLHLLLLFRLPVVPVRECRSVRRTISGIASLEGPIISPLRANSGQLVAQHTDTLLSAQHRGTRSIILIPPRTTKIAWYKIEVSSATNDRD